MTEYKGYTIVRVDVMGSDVYCVLDAPIVEEHQFGSLGMAKNYIDSWSK